LDEAIQELKENDYKELFKDELLERKYYDNDCQIEIDKEVLIPDNYINQINERLSLYMRLDNVKNENEIEAIREEMEDRFGPVPNLVEDLFDVIRLRWDAVRLGIEKLTLKKEHLKCYFISNRDSVFFDSDVFSNILDYVKNHPLDCVMKQVSNRLMLTIKEINNIREAQNRFLEIMQMAERPSQVTTTNQK